MSHCSFLPAIVRQCVLQFLDAEDKKNASLMNSQWRETFTDRVCFDNYAVKLLSCESPENITRMLRNAKHLRIVLPYQSQPVDQSELQLLGVGTIYNIVQHCCAVHSIKLRFSKYTYYCKSVCLQLTELYERARGNLSNLKEFHCESSEHFSGSDELKKLIAACNNLRKLDITVNKYETADIVDLLACLQPSIRYLAIRPKVYPTRNNQSYMPIIQAFIDLADKGFRLRKLFLPIGPRELQSVTLISQMQELLQKYDNLLLELAIYGCGREDSYWYKNLALLLSAVKFSTVDVTVSMSARASQSIEQLYYPPTLLKQLKEERLESFSLKLLTVEAFDGELAREFSSEGSRKALRRFVLSCPVVNASAFLCGLSNLRVLDLQSSMQKNWNRRIKPNWNDEQLLSSIVHCCPLLEVLKCSETVRFSYFSCGSNHSSYCFKHLKSLNFYADCSTSKPVKFRVFAPSLRSIKVKFVNERRSNFSLHCAPVKSITSTAGMSIKQVCIIRAILKSCPTLVYVGYTSSRTLHNAPELWSALSDLSFLREFQIGYDGDDLQCAAAQIFKGAASCRSLKIFKVRAAPELILLLNKALSSLDHPVKVIASSI